MFELTWRPTPLEMMQANVAVLTDRLPEASGCNAMFIHGGCVRDDGLDQELLESAFNRYASGQVCKIILNGLTLERCRKESQAYDGYEMWQASLLSQGMPGADIYVLPPSSHTAAESKNFLLLAKEEGWDRVAISSRPHHQLRSFLQIIALMDEVDFHPKVYNAVGPGIDWNYSMKKPVMSGKTVMGGGEVQGTLIDHIAAEFDRIVAYAQPPEIVDGKPKYIRNATIPEMLVYLEQRDKR